MTTLNRGQFVRLLATGAAAPFVLSACGSDDDSAGGSDSPEPDQDQNPTSTSPSNKPADGPQDGVFPATIKHKYGETTIDEAPSRVVCIGLSEHDALLALGVVPIATTSWYGAYPGEIGPWAKPALGDAPLPEVLPSGDGVDIAKVVKLEPDLVLALYSALSDEDYETLSKIAPVVAQPGEYVNYGIPWQQLTRTVGQAVGKAGSAEKLIDGVETSMAKARKDHPVLTSSEGVVATPYQGMYVYGPEDPRSRFVHDLGLSLPDGLAEIAGDDFGGNLSEERVDLLETDVVVWLLGSDAKADADKLHDNALYGDLDVVKQGREVFIADPRDYGRAFSFVSVLSIPYVLKRFVPQLVAALDGDPATKVPEAS